VRSHLLLCVLVSWWIGSGAASAAQRSAVSMGVSPHLRTAELLSTADANDSLAMSLTLHLAHRDELDSLIAAQQRPGAPEYHQWLSPEAFTARFAPAPDTYAALADWLDQQGFAVRRWPNRVRLDFTGTVRTVERAFRVHMNRYRHRGRQVLANADAPLLPARFDAAVAFLRLNTIPLAEPLVHLISSQDQRDAMGPHDMYRAYNVQPVLDRGVDGSGQTIAVVARSDFDVSDVIGFQQQFGTLVRDPIKVFTGANPGIGAPQLCNGSPDRQGCMLGEEIEVLLDVEWAGSLAPGATVLVDISGTDIDASLMDAVTNHPEAKVVTVSFGRCERTDNTSLPLFAPLYAQAAVQGQTVVVATGDDGADGCADGKGASVNLLASDPNVTAVGGTALDPGFDAQGNATGHVSESVWNDQHGASGGGPSAQVSKPAYQVAPGVPEDGQRDQPDVALLSSPSTPGYVITVRGGVTVVGGTSVAAPAWGGIVALVNQATQNGGSGAINYTLYPLGQKQYAENGPAVFYDITAGDNTVTDVHGNVVQGFAAGVGYDLATGLGTPNVDLLIQALAPLVCAGDCNGDGIVTVDELIAGVNIALGAASVSACPPMDTNHDDQVTIDELIAATQCALTGS
jgi:subtilase family serine protease